MAVGAPASATLQPIPTVPTGDSASLKYELRPAHRLPDLDLSVSLKSRVLSPRTLRIFDAFIKRNHRLLYATYLMASVGYPIFLILPLRESRYMSIFVFLLALPATIVGTSYLRYSVIKVLLKRTYEVWYFSIINSITFVACGITLGDIRSLALVVPWLGFEMIILVDANLRAIRRLVQSTVVATVILSASLAFAALGWVEGIQNAILWCYKTHEVPSQTLVFNGMTTLIALGMRNTWRYRSALKMTKASRPGSGVIVNCIAYRCTLRFSIVNESDAAQDVAPMHDGSASTTAPTTHRAVYMQQMLYQPELGTIDSAETLVPLGYLRRLDHLLNTQRVMWFLNRCSVLLTLGAPAVDYLITKSNPDASPWLHVVATLVVTIFFLFSAAHYQKVILRAIGGSFEFLFLDAQAFVVHLAMCDFFHWSSRVLILVFLSWTWMHWVLFVDALTPRIRDMLGIDIHLIAHATGFCLGTSVLVVYLLVFSEYSMTIFDRVLYHKTFMNFELELRVSPIFYSCFITLLGWAVKFFWRVCTCNASDLVMVDGPVVYDNYLRKTSRRDSVPWTIRQHKPAT